MLSLQCGPLALSSLSFLWRRPPGSRGVCEPDGLSRALRNNIAVATNERDSVRSTKRYGTFISSLTAASSFVTPLGDAARATPWHTENMRS